MTYGGIYLSCPQCWDDWDYADVTESTSWQWQCPCCGSWNDWGARPGSLAELARRERGLVFDARQLDLFGGEAA